MRQYPTLSKLNSGETIQLEGVSWHKVKGDLQPGDWYIAERNTGPQLLTVKEIKDLSAITCIRPFVIPKENAYAYDLRECVKVLPIY